MSFPLLPQRLTCLESTPPDRLTDSSIIGWSERHEATGSDRKRPVSEGEYEDRLCAGEVSIRVETFSISEYVSDEALELAPSSQNALACEVVTDTTFEESASPAT